MLVVLRFRLSFLLSHIKYFRTEPQWCGVCASLRVRPCRGIATPFQRIAVVLSGDVLSVEYHHGGESQRIEIVPGQVEWEEPTDRVHRAVNVGEQNYEQVTVFLLDRPGAVPQPTEE